MSELRALVRELLREEIAALRGEILGAVQAEPVAVGSEAELTGFALAVARRVQEPGFLAALEGGRIRYAPAGPAAAHVPAPQPALQLAPQPAPRPVPGRPVAAQPVTLVSTMPAPVPELRKGLITERDIAAVAEGETRLRVSKTARITPLAGDEARRRGIRIERTTA